MKNKMAGKNQDFPRRGEIYWASFDPAIGNETKKARPSLIISNDTGNETSGTVIIAPITSKVSRVYPFEVKVSVGDRPGKVMLNQCRTVDKSRLSKKVGSVDDGVMKLVEDAIKIVFGLS